MGGMKKWRPRDYEELRCATCGDKFKQKRKWQKYCGEACKWRAAYLRRS